MANYIYPLNVKATPSGGPVIYLGINQSNDQHFITDISQIHLGVPTSEDNGVYLQRKQNGTVEWVTAAELSTAISAASLVSNWRTIKIKNGNNEEDATPSNGPLTFKAGSNIQLTQANNEITINVTDLQTNIQVGDDLVFTNNTIRHKLIFDESTLNNLPENPSLYKIKFDKNGHINRISKFQAWEMFRLFYAASPSDGLQAVTFTWWKDKYGVFEAEEMSAPIEVSYEDAQTMTFNEIMTLSRVVDNETQTVNRNLSKYTFADGSGVGVPNKSLIVHKFDGNNSYYRIYDEMWYKTPGTYRIWGEASVIGVERRTSDYRTYIVGPAPVPTVTYYYTIVTSDDENYITASNYTAQAQQVTEDQINTTPFTMNAEDKYVFIVVPVGYTVTGQDPATGGNAVFKTYNPNKDKYMFALSTVGDCKLYRTAVKCYNIRLTITKD